MEAHNTTTVSFWQFSCMSVWVCCAMPHFHFHAHKLYLNLQLNKLDIKNWFKLFAIVLCVCKQFNVPNNANAIDANSHAYPSHSDLTFFFLAHCSLIQLNPILICYAFLSYRIDRDQKRFRVDFMWKMKSNNFHRHSYHFQTIAKSSDFFYAKSKDIEQLKQMKCFGTNVP